MTIPPDGGLLIYTDGLPDSIPGDSPEDSLHGALDKDLARTMSNLKALVDPRFNEDDVTVLLVKRTAGSGPLSPSAREVAAFEQISPAAASAPSAEASGFRSKP